MLSKTKRCHVPCHSHLPHRLQLQECHEKNCCFCSLVPASVFVLLLPSHLAVSNVSSFFFFQKNGIYDIFKLCLGASGHDLIEAKVLWLYGFNLSLPLLTSCCTGFASHGKQEKSHNKVVLSCLHFQIPLYLIKEYFSFVF